MPVAVRSSVVLPAPFGPSRATTSPRPTERLTPRSTIVSPYPASTCSRHSAAASGASGAPAPSTDSDVMPAPVRAPRRPGTRPAPRRSAPSPRACPRRSACRSRARTRRSHTERTSVMSCSTSRIPHPRSRTTSSSTCPKRSVSCPSRPDDGSSSRSRSKRPARCRASSTSRRWPIGSSPTWRRRCGPVPVSASASSVAAAMARLEAREPDELRERVASGHRGFAAHRDVLAHGQAVEQLGALERATEPAAGPLGGAVVGHVVTVQQHASGARLQQAAARVERRRLPGAVGPDEPGDRRPSARRGPRGRPPRRRRSAPRGRGPPGPPATVADDRRGADAAATATGVPGFMACAGAGASRPGHRAGRRTGGPAPASHPAACPTPPSRPRGRRGASGCWSCSRR